MVMSSNCGAPPAKASMSAFTPRSSASGVSEAQASRAASMRLRAVERARGVRGLGDAVGVDEELVAGLERELVLAVAHVLHPGEDEAVLIPEELEPAAPPAYGGVLVAGVRGRDAAGGDLVDAEPDGDEHLRVVVLAELVVDGLEYLPGRRAHLRAVLEQGLGDDHEERGGHALAGDVGDHEREMVLVHEEEVVEVAADLLGGGHGGVDVELAALREGGEDAGQHARLYLRRHVQLRAYPLLLRRDAREVVYIGPERGGHVVEGVAEDGGLVVRPSPRA